MILRHFWRRVLKKKVWRYQIFFGEIYALSIQCPIDLQNILMIKYNSARKRIQSLETLHFLDTTNGSISKLVICMGKVTSLSCVFSIRSVLFMSWSMYIGMTACVYRGALLYLNWTEALFMAWAAPVFYLLWKGPINGCSPDGQRFPLNSGSLNQCKCLLSD